MNDPIYCLAAAAASLDWRTIDTIVARQAKDLVIDTVGVIAAGLTNDGYHAFAKAAATGSGNCTLIGCGQSVSADTAAMIHAGATTVLQWQDGHRIARGHPASQLVPVLLALAQETNAPTHAVMTAFVAGYEVGVRIGIAMGGMADDLHDSGSWVSIGAAAAVAHLLTAGNIDAIANAIEGAAAIALQPYRATATAGAAVHHLYMGMGSTVALAAGRAAAVGLPSLKGTLTDFFAPRAGKAFTPSLLLDGIEDGTFSRFELMNGYLKWHPVCAHFSGVADATAAIIRTYAPVRAEMADVLVEIYGYALEYQNGSPTSDLAGRFSIPAIVASLLSGRPLEHQLVLDDPFMAAIEVRHDPALDANYPAGRPARVTVRMKDGTQHIAEVTAPYGDACNPMRPEDRINKAERMFATGKLPNALAGIERYLDRGEIAHLSEALS